MPVAGPAIALAAFMGGAAVGGRVLRGDLHAWTPRHTWLFACVGAVLLLAAVPAVLADSPGRGLQYAITAALGAAMGCQAATARHIAVKDVTTVVVTSTLTGLASDSVLGRGEGQPWKRRAGAIVLIGLGRSHGRGAAQGAPWLGPRARRAHHCGRRVDRSRGAAATRDHRGLRRGVILYARAEWVTRPPTTVSATGIERSAVAVTVRAS